MHRTTGNKGVRILCSQAIEARIQKEPSANMPVLQGLKRFKLYLGFRDLDLSVALKQGLYVSAIIDGRGRILVPRETQTPRNHIKM